MITVLSLAVSACSSDGGVAATTAPPGTTGAPATSTAAPALTTPAPATTSGSATTQPSTPGSLASPNHAELKVTGADTIDVNGAGGYCQYFIPASHEGLVYVVHGDEFGQPGWTLQVSGNGPDSMGVLLNTSQHSYANDAALSGGTINAQADLHHADFDLDLVEMTNQTVNVHVTGSIDCP
jgi:hypothetical protein